MRILWLTPSLPCPATGNRVRQFNLIKQLSREHQFTVLSFMIDFEANYVDLLRPYCTEVIAVPLPLSRPVGRWRNRVQSWLRLLFDPRPGHILTYPIPVLRRELDHLLVEKSFDLIHVETLHPLRLVDQSLAGRTLLVEQNVESTVQGRRCASTSHPLGKFREWVEWRKLKRFENAQLRRFPVLVAVSEADASQCRMLAPKAQVSVVPNGVDVNWFAPPTDRGSRQRQGLLFVGTMDYAPNIDAALFFCQEIWPLLRQLAPEIMLTIAGAHPVPAVQALGRLPGITVTGFVEDMRPYFWKAAVCVVPLRNGGGTRLKILEAMAAELPVVSTSIGAEGLRVTDGKNILLADDPQPFACAVSRIISSPELFRKLREEGRSLIEQEYDWRIIAQKLDRVYRSMSNLAGLPVSRLK